MHTALERSKLMVLVAGHFDLGEGRARDTDDGVAVRANRNPIDVNRNAISFDGFARTGLECKLTLVGDPADVGPPGLNRSFFAGGKQGKSSQNRSEDLFHFMASPDYAYFTGVSCAVVAVLTVPQRAVRSGVPTRLRKLRLQHERH